MKKREIVLAMLAVSCFLLGVLCLTALPGVRFSGILLLCLAGLCVLTAALRRWKERSQTGRICWRCFFGILCVFFALFAGVEALLVSQGSRAAPETPVDAVIVLGAGVNGETPSLILQSRIDAAAAYLRAHPGIPAVLSGGQGPGEDIPEAEAMRRALTADGIAEQRLYLETASTSTAENFAFSGEILRQAGVDLKTARIAVVTSDFHCFRANLLARREGIAAMDVPARAPWPLLNANYYIREFFALGKTLIFD